MAVGTDIISPDIQKHDRSILMVTLQGIKLFSLAGKVTHLTCLVVIQRTCYMIKSYLSNVVYVQGVSFQCTMLNIILDVKQNTYVGCEQYNL